MGKHRHRSWVNGVEVVDGQPARPLSKKRLYVCKFESEDYPEYHIALIQATNQDALGLVCKDICIYLLDILKAQFELEEFWQVTPELLALDATSGIDNVFFLTAPELEEA